MRAPNYDFVTFSRKNFEFDKLAGGPLKSFDQISSPEKGSQCIVKILLMSYNGIIMMLMST